MNGYRQNTLVTVEEGQAPLIGCAFAKPDLTASLLRITTGASERTLTVRIGNAGESQAPAEVAVSFYDGDPRLGGTRIGTVFTSSLLAAGQFVDVALTVPITTSTAGSIWVAATILVGFVETSPSRMKTTTCSTHASHFSEARVEDSPI